MPEEEEVLRVIRDKDGFAVILPVDGEWARSADPRLLESYVSLRLHEVTTEPTERRWLLNRLRRQVRVEAVGS